MTFEDFIMIARQKKASDIHLTADLPPMFRVNGELSQIEELNNVPVTKRMIISLLNAQQEENFIAGKDIDFAFELSNGCRQRANVYRHMGKVACAIRLLNDSVPTIEELGLPPFVKDIATKKSGLVLVTGMTGSGKTTTLSVMLDYINSTRACHIITLEDPVEYRYTPKLATIHQREIGRDVGSFQDALRSALREDPDVILVGEMRDYETMQLAVTAAETGHLVFATIHTRGAIRAVNRIVDAGPPELQQQTTVQLSQILECVISQSLLPLKNGSGRIAALEILVGTDAVRNIIRANKAFQLETAMQQGKHAGMCLMDDVILDYYRRDMITRDVALFYAEDRVSMSTKLR